MANISDLNFEKIKAVNNPVGESGQTMAHEFMRKGGKLTIENILELGDPVDDDGISLSLIYAFSRSYTNRLTSKFELVRISAREMVALGNPKMPNGEFVSIYFAKNGFHYTFEEIKLLGNPLDLEGISLLYLSALSGHYYSCDQILALGNPRTPKGESVPHVLAKFHHDYFSFDEIIRLGNPIYRGKTIADYMHNPSTNR
jgi:hypothetical protein